MSEKIYQTPSAELEKSVYIYNEGSSTKAIVSGILITFVGKFIVGILMAIIYGRYFVNSEESGAEAQAIFYSSNLPIVLGVITVILFLLISLYAGYVCAKNSMFNVYRDTAIMYCVVLVIEVLFLFSIMESFRSNQILSQQYGEESFLTGNITISAISFMSAFLGAFIWKRKFS